MPELGPTYLGLSRALLTLSPIRLDMGLHQLRP